MRFGNNVEKKNFNGGPAYALSGKQELIKACLTSFLSSDFYEKEDDKVKRIAELVRQVDQRFALNLAAFSRDYGLRSVNHVILAEVSKNLRGKPQVRNTLTKAFDTIVKRPDELSEIFGYYAFSTGQNLNSVKVPNAMKVAAGRKLSKFPEFQLAKYKGKSSDFNLYDLVNVCHPSGNASIGKLMNGTLESADTWEAEISANGNNKESWIRLIDENKLGALALVRNLRNMLQAGVEQSVLEDAIRRADFRKVFPFQAIQAMDACVDAGFENGPMFDAVFAKAIESFEAIGKRYEGKVAIGIDVSGSMFGSPVTKMSKFDRAKLAIAYGFLIRAVTGGELYFWSSTDYNSTKGVWHIDDKTSYQEAYKFAQEVSSGTRVSLFTDEIKDKGYDWAIVLTDEQSGVPLVNVAKKGTVVWGIHDYRDTVASGNGVTAFYGYDDIMWKVSSDIFRLGELEKEIEKYGL